MASDNTIVKNIVNELKEKSENVDRTNQKGLVNDKTGSSIILDENGNVTIAPSKTVQYKMKYNEGQTTEISFQSNTITNRKNIKTDEIIINKHKLNNQLFELTDFKRIDGDPTSAIGNLTMMGTVLVKAWEPYLEKWVLIRRQVRIPIFSNMLPIPDVPATMGLVNEDGTSATDVSKEITEMRTYDEQQKAFK